MAYISSHTTDEEIACKIRMLRSVDPILRSIWLVVAGVSTMLFMFSSIYFTGRITGSISMCCLSLVGWWVSHLVTQNELAQWEAVNSARLIKKAGLS